MNKNKQKKVSIRVLKNEPKESLTLKQLTSIIKAEFLTKNQEAAVKEAMINSIKESFRTSNVYMNANSEAAAGTTADRLVSDVRRIIKENAKKNGRK